MKASFIDGTILGESRFISKVFISGYTNEFGVTGALVHALGFVSAYTKRLPRPHFELSSDMQNIFFGGLPSILHSAILIA